MKKRLLAILLVAIMTVLAAVPAMAAGSDLNAYESALLQKFEENINSHSWIGNDLKAQYLQEAEAALKIVDLNADAYEALANGMKAVMAVLDSNNISSLSGAKTLNRTKLLDATMNAFSKAYALTVTLDGESGQATVTVNGWAKDSKNAWHYYTNGQESYGWKKIGGAWYFFDKSTGAMKTGWIHNAGKWYYATGNGKMVTGWKKIDGKWYYFDPTNNGNNGHMETGWQKIDGAWYYLGTNGAMFTGWNQVGKNWYYMGTNGIVREKWQQIGGKWYYFKPYNSGAMVTGWQQINGKWYYFFGGSDGSMATGWQLISGKWYYFFGGNNGSMATGWQKIGGTWYYFKPGNSGQMVTGTQTINGKTYTFDANGAWIG